MRNWVSLRRLALILDMPLSKVKRMHDDGTISGLQFGKDFYVYRDEVERLLKARGGEGITLPSSLLKDKKVG
jgi:hypothetical protein